ncbi:DUF3574 domain-containing protein [Streptomyces sp. NPDC059649]|uniref:DUF3574 domain-containing protein n=1 Tax=Streptomyces sp. NPDC059649 TaxID=3346895 RepID=UPI0036880A89
MLVTGRKEEDAFGQFRDTHGKIERERSHKVTLLPLTDQAGPVSRKIEAIRAEYTKLFRPESVARIDDRELVDF